MEQDIKKRIMQYIREYGDELFLSEKTIETAISIFLQYKNKRNYSGQHPRVLAGACLYTASQARQEARTQHEISSKTLASVTALRVRYKDIIAWCDLRSYYV